MLGLDFVGEARGLRFFFCDDFSDFGTKYWGLSKIRTLTTWIFAYFGVFTNDDDRDGLAFNVGIGFEGAG